jgi:hypothetical protein
MEPSGQTRDPLPPDRSAGPPQPVRKGLVKRIRESIAGRFLQAKTALENLKSYAAALLKSISSWLPSKEFRKDFWPAFWATAIGALLAIPGGMATDRFVKARTARTHLPAICRELKADEPKLRTFVGLKTYPADAVRQLASPNRAVSTSLEHQSIDAIDNSDLVSAISDTYSTLDEVNQDLDMYQEAYFSSKDLEPTPKELGALNLLLGTSTEALEKVENAIKLIRLDQGAAACDQWN